MMYEWKQTYLSSLSVVLPLLPTLCTWATMNPPPSPSFPLPDVLSHWLGLMHAHSDKDASTSSNQGVSGGWMPREQILGEAARRRVPQVFIPQDVTVANPPSLFLAVRVLLSRARNDSSAHSISHDGGTASAARQRRQSFLLSATPLLDQWVRWLLATQRVHVRSSTLVGGAPVGSFQWQGRDPKQDILNPNTMASGLDDYPRASHPSEHDAHVDGLCWLIHACQVMAELFGELGPQLGVMDMLPYRKIAQELLAQLDYLHWSTTAGAYLDVGLHSAQGNIQQQVSVICRAKQGHATKHVGMAAEQLYKQGPSCPPDFPVPVRPVTDGRGALETRERWVGEPPQVQQVERLGYVSIFPLLLRLLPPDSPRLPPLLDLLADPTHLWSEYGLRSLSKSDPFYLKANNPGDQPYWRGYIWININFFACAALHHYSKQSGPIQERSANLYANLRGNILSTVLGEFHRTGYFWEQYDDATGHGRRGHPFTGWTATVLNIITEQYE
eukprot:TRINITY_DN5191_c0_g1_i3.p1 TRINITY_DN5191_c0_g1~~TRINITY_DN5191_c0_g1_i3.p1  ORF type:complete len:500 (-),score=82.65 TRINITY_DN5191_c0_g1_i3:425-1924(-)